MNIRPAFILTILLAVCGAVIGYQQSIITQTREEAMQATTALGKERQARIAAENAGRALAQNERSASKDAFALRDMVAKLEHELASVRQQLTSAQEGRQAVNKGYSPKLKSGAEDLLRQPPALRNPRVLTIYHNKIGEEEISCWITDDIVMAGPAWRPGLPLPLDPAEAEQRSRRVLSQLIEDQEAWDMQEISLHKLAGRDNTYWYYAMSFSAPRYTGGRFTVMMSMGGVPGMYSHGYPVRN